ncbi:MAG: hypothetical protein KTR16_03675 [Acidiferrobacterales bacterium]|nr:hypothetical protein [Acidiferrobacterales bacterium]
MKLAVISNLVTIFSALLLSNIASADMNEKMDQLCSKMKQCTLETQGMADQPPEILAMMDSMFDGMCKQMLQPYTNTIGEAGLEDKAEACMDSFLDQSCDVIMANQRETYESPECKEFEKAADEAGVDLGQ